MTTPTFQTPLEKELYEALKAALCRLVSIQDQTGDTDEWLGLEQTRAAIDKAEKQ